MRTLAVQQALFTQPTSCKSSAKSVLTFQRPTCQPNDNEVRHNFLPNHSLNLNYTKKGANTAMRMTLLRIYVFMVFLFTPHPNRNAIISHEHLELAFFPTTTKAHEYLIINIPSQTNRILLLLPHCFIV
jgi:hypothetical protein